MHLSFEFFPPKTESGLQALKNTADQLNTARPEFFSVTFGAFGSTQNRTLDTLLMLKKAGYKNIAAHITCIGSSKERIRALLTSYKEHGINHLVVLRGDLPSGSVEHHSDFKYAYQLIEFIREKTGTYFFIDVAAYPEMHPETLNATQHATHLRMKLAAGANRAITQYFFNADAYFQLLDDCEKHNINIPIIPGIMPITNYTQLARFSKMCGAQIPRWLAIRLETMKDDPQAIFELGQAFLSNLCERLAQGGAPGLHFYTLNKAQPSLDLTMLIKKHASII